MNAETEPDTPEAPVAPVAPPPGWRRPARVLRHMAEFIVRRRVSEPPRLVFTPVGGHHQRHTMAPEMYDAPHELRQRIDHLARSGALDEGNGNVCDDLINLWVEQWCDEVQDEYDDRLIELRLRVAEAEAEVRRREYLVERAEAELRRSETRYDRLNHEFQMPDPPAAPRPRHGRSEKR